MNIVDLAKFYGMEEAIARKDGDSLTETASRIHLAFDNAVDQAAYMLRTMLEEGRLQEAERCLTEMESILGPDHIAVRLVRIAYLDLQGHASQLLLQQCAIHLQRIAPISTDF